ncbi:MAG TPA: hypothetical protein DDZ51_01995 [Planctomycetaceae bacterium]|nr:hypothetical protein [Planctomycetaceae bacterium]
MGSETRIGKGRKAITDAQRRLQSAGTTANRFLVCRRSSTAGLSRHQMRNTNGPIGAVGAIALIKNMWFNPRSQTQPTIDSCGRAVRHKSLPGDRNRRRPADFRIKPEPSI